MTLEARYGGNGAPPENPDSDDLLRLVVESATDFAVIAIDIKGDVTVWNIGAERLLGYAQADMIGASLEQIFTPEDRMRRIFQSEMRTALCDGRAQDDRWHVRRDGSRFWGAGLMMPLRQDGGGFIKIIRDQTRAKLDQERLVEAERQLTNLVKGIPQLIWRSCDAGNWIWASQQWLDYTGQTLEQALEWGWLDVVHPADRDTASAAWIQARTSGGVDVEFRLRRAADDTWHWHHTRSLPLLNDGGVIVEWLGTTTDIEALKALQQSQDGLLRQAQQHTRDLEAEIRERKLAESELLYVASHDDLTKLWNRATFIERTTVALARLRSDESSDFAVLFLDVDRFKLINDSMGHHVGDLLLMEVSKRLKAGMVDLGMLARLGGDEFGILIEGPNAAAAAVDAAKIITEVMRRPIWLGRQEVFVSCSIGIVTARPDHYLPEELLRDADTAMYFSKRANPGGYAIFADTMRGDAVDALQLQIDLRQALGRGEFVLHYQPIFDTSTMRIIGLEALIRWQHPRRGEVLPGAFIPAAEESGLIREIGRWVLQEACRQVLTWRAQFPSTVLFLNVNASTRELRDRQFVDEVRDTLGATGFDPRELQLEVTETVFLQQPVVAGEILSSLRAMGVRIALDDFGTGYSSLGYLERYPVDTIKIDRSFTARMPAVPGVAIVHAIVALGLAMGLDIIAEGVEDADQLRILMAAGCGAVQGYLLGRPVSAAEMTLELGRHSSPG